MSARIHPENLFGRALGLDEILPVESRNRPQTGYAVRDRDLRERNASVRSRRRFFRAWPIFRDPLLEPDERREVRLVRTNLLEKARYPRRRELRMIVHEGCKRLRKRFGRALACFAELRRRYVRGLHFLESRRHAQCHPADVLDESEPEHRWDRPQFTHPQRGDLLVLAHEQRDVV
jgi:hypothetical protein